MPSQVLLPDKRIVDWVIDDAQSSAISLNKGPL
jgi:hypothetical protein